MLNFTRAFAYLSLLGVISQSLSASDVGNKRRQTGGPSSPADDIPADAKKLPKDCQDIIYVAGSKANTDEYFVQLKLSATANDVAALLALPSINGVKTIQTYTKEYDKGLSAKLSYEQVCTLHKDARVGRILVCEGDRCAPETKATNPPPGPSKNSGVKGAPDISGLSEPCARVVWYTILEYDPTTIDPGKFIAATKVWVSQKDADAFFVNQPGTIRNKTAETDGYYAGKWSYSQLCDIEKSPLVSRVETIAIPVPYGGKPPVTGKGRKI